MFRFWDKADIDYRCLPISIYEWAFINKKGRRPKPMQSVAFAK